MKLVIYPAVEPDRLQKILEAAGKMRVVNCSGPSEALREVEEADAFFGKITPALLAQAAHLRWVQAPTASLEHYVFPELISHPCQLTNMRGLFSDVIADHVFGLILCFARNLHRYIRNQAARHWEPAGGEPDRSDFTTGPGRITALDRAHLHLADSTLGVVGLGYIGKEIARRGLAFGMRVVAVDPVETQAPEWVSALWKPEELSKLLAASDFVVIAAPHTPQTAKMFRRAQFQEMKKTAYLINIGRGVIVDLSDLTAALLAREIAGAGLDVFETEPLPAEHPLWEMDNVIITPHVAGYSPRIPERHLAVLLDNIGRFTRDEPLQNVVDKVRWF
jgi:phosphoglycerate dehydrogenase-like enzyme